MSGVETLTTVIALAGTAIQVIGAIYKFFGKIENVPVSLKDLHKRLEEFQDEFENLNKAFKESGSSLSERRLQAVKDTLEDCQQFLVKFKEVTEGKWSVGGGLKTIWLAQDDAAVERLHRRIDRHYLDAIMPSMSTIITRLNEMDERIRTRTVARIHGSKETDEKPIRISEDDLDSLFREFQQIREDHHREESLQEYERTLEQLKEALNRAWAALSLPPPETGSFLGLPEPHRRPSALQLKPIPATLCFKYNTPEGPQKTEQPLQRVAIMARDEVSRILQYQTSENEEDNVTLVNQIIPKGTIPWTDPLHPLEISFLAEHMVTIIGKKGYKIYKVDPHYRFETMDDSKTFQGIFRDRDLLGSFMAIEIREMSARGHDIREFSRRQIIKIWKRDMEVTMTFLATSRGNGRNHEEFGLSAFGSAAERTKLNRKHAVKLSKVGLGHDSESRLRGNLWISFADEEGMAGFANAFNQHHPRASISSSTTGGRHGSTTSQTVSSSSGSSQRAR